METTNEKLKPSQEFLDMNGIHPHALVSDCNGSRKVVHGLLEKFHHQQSTSQKETIERLRRELSHLIKALETVHSFGATKPIIEGAEQLLKETEQ